MAVTPSSKSDALTALHLRRWRFQKLESSFSLQQNSSSSDQSSSEAGASPRRRFYWSTGQRTVVSARGDSESSKEQSPVRTWTAGKSHTSTSPRQSSGNNSRRCDDLAGRRPQPQSHQHKPWEAAVRVGQSVVESSSSPSDRMSPDSVSAASARLCEDGRSDEESCRLASSGGSRVGKESPKSEVALVNGLRGESAGKSVRELARHFEARGTK